jgi:hypothetical protein
MNEGIILNIGISMLISIMSFYLVKKLQYKPLQFKEHRLRFFFGMFWLSVSLIYAIVTIIETLSLFGKFYTATILFITAATIPVIPVLSLASFLSVAIFGRSKKSYIFPTIMLIGSISYAYFVIMEGINGPLITQYSTQWFLNGPIALLLTQALGYTAFAMCLLLFFIAFKTKKKLIVFKIMLSATSISLFFLAGYLDLLGPKGFDIIIIRGVIALGVIVGYYAFFPMKWMEKLVKMISSFN